MLPEKIQERIKENFYNYLDACDIIRDIEGEIEAQKKQNADEIATSIVAIEKEEYKKEGVREYHAECIKQRGYEVSRLSPFITETVVVSGQELDRRSIIPYTSFNDPGSEDVKLFFDDVNIKWFIRVKNGLPKLVSRFWVEACLIVDAYASGACRALVVFMRGCQRPLIFWEGIITSADLRKQTQFHKKGLTVRNRDYYYESFIRALCMCSNVFFLTLPKHSGWNTTPDGRRVFVSAANMIPVLSDLFND